MIMTPSGRDASSISSLIGTKMSADPASHSTSGFCIARTRYSAHRSITRRSEEHTSELQSLMRISYAVFCLKKTIDILNILSNFHLLLTLYNYRHYLNKLN